MSSATGTGSTTETTGSGGSGGSGGQAGSTGGAGGGGAGGAAPQTSWLDATGRLPPTLEETGLYADLTDLGSYDERAILYQPGHALWSNGSVKQRFIVLPKGAQVDTQDRGAWQFPEGTVFFKTFSYEDEEAKDGLRPIETRVLQKTAEGWEFHAYLWARDRSSAKLLDGVFTTPVQVEYEGETFEHVVPARLDCRTCHESQPVRVIGFDELRLNSPLVAGGPSQLTSLYARGVLSELPDDPDEIVHADDTTREVLGYLQGNCAHCHNGWQGPSSAFDLRHDVALENLISVDTTSELLSGVRVVPGDPEASALFRALSRDAAFPDGAVMPPVGVDLVDRKAVALFRGWIEALDPP